MTNELQTIADRIGRKSIAVDKGLKKIKNLDGQIEMCLRSKEAVQSEIEGQQAEIDGLIEIQNKVKELVAKRDELSEYLAGLVAHYSAFEWRMDMPWEEKIESSDYTAKTAEKFAVIAQIEELVKSANKIYYRR